ncbi:MAG: long-chain fatty acid--CoA ligase [Waddliaceae bacterium]
MGLDSLAMEHSAIPSSQIEKTESSEALPHLLPCIEPSPEFCEPQSLEPEVDMEALHTIGEVVQYMEEHRSNPTAFNFLDEGCWKHLSTEVFLFDLKRITYGLISLGMKRGDKVGIFAPSSPQWNLADFAIILAGGITVPLFPRISDENLIYEVAQANIRFTFVQGKDQWTMYDRHRSLFEKVIALDDPGDVEGALTFHEIVTTGESLWEKKPRLWEELILRLHTDDVCTIIYTSGSTGMPKGVELTHQNLVHLITADAFDWGKDEDVYLSLLPLAHVFARQINLILICRGVSIYYLNDPGLFTVACRELRPTLMIVVPRLLEKIYAAFEAKIDKESNPWKRKLGRWAFHLAAEEHHSFLKKWLLRPLADFFVFSTFREPFGEKWRVILCGGAALDVRVYRFFLRCGFPVYEGWGLTEGSTICTNTLGALKVGTVGRTLPGIKIKLSQEGEILVAGPTVMKGYYRNPEATMEAKDEEGWLHTGDKGEIDQEGYLSITGRVKEQFKLSSGEYLSPGRIEHMLCRHPLIDLALVVGEGRKHPIALLFPDGSYIKELKKFQNSHPLSTEEFLQTPWIKKEMEQFLETINARMNQWEQIVHYRFIADTPTVEEGALTPTLRLKREYILEKYRGFINDIYGKEAT